MSIMQFRDGKVAREIRDFGDPLEPKAMFRRDPWFKRAFEALTPGRQRGYLDHFAGAKQSATRTARIEKAMPAIFEGRGFLERRRSPTAAACRKADVDQGL